MPARSARSAADPALNVSTLVIAGGDGSINEALTGFQDHPDPPQLAVIPFGTANVLALELGLPRTPRAIAEMIFQERTKPLHYGIANGRPFVLMASTGFRRRGGSCRTAGAEAASRQAGLCDHGAQDRAQAQEQRRCASTWTGNACPGSSPLPAMRATMAARSSSARAEQPIRACTCWCSSGTTRCHPSGTGSRLMLGRIHKASGASVTPFSTARISAARSRRRPGRRRPVRRNAAGNQPDRQDRARAGALEASVVPGAAPLRPFPRSLPASCAASCVASLADMASPKKKPCAYSQPSW